VRIFRRWRREWQNRKNKRSGRDGAAPLYTIKDAEESLQCFQPVRYDEVLFLADGVKARFRDAGHILGSAMIEIWVEEGGQEKKLVFSGDLGSVGQPIVRDPTVVEKEGDLLWLESTYGDRLHRSREETIQELLRIHPGCRSWSGESRHPCLWPWRGPRISSTPSVN